MYNKGDFCSYLSAFRVEKGCEFTHTSIVKPTGAFYIPADEEDEFYRRYIEAKKHGEELYLTEKHKSMGPVVIDLDFRFAKDHSSEYPIRQYNENHIRSIIKLYLEKLLDIVELSGVVPRVYVMEKPSPVHDKNMTKDGIHILIPGIVTRPSVQYIVRQEVLKQLPDILSNLSLTNSINDIVDEAVIHRNNWQMYGSKKPNCEAYKVSKIYDVKDDFLLEPVCLSNEDTDYIDILSIRNKFEETPLKIDKVSLVTEFEEAQRIKSKMNMDRRLSKINDKKNTSDELGLVEQLVDILSPSRAERFDDWIRIGWCLRNIDYRLMNKWDDFSKRSSKYSPGECERLWNTMKEDGLGIGSLHMWAKQDNKEAYDKIIEKDLFNLISNSSSKTHHDIAKVVYYLYKYEFACASIKHNYWFEFKNHRWIPCDCANTLRLHLSNEVVKKYCAGAAYYSNKAATEDDSDARERYTEKSKKLLEIANKLKDSPFKENILKECRDLFYIEKFEEKLDSKCHLLGFNNGVYDLEADEFREGRPEDYISFTTGISYIDYDQDHPYMKYVLNFLEKVFTKTEVRDYVLKVLSSFMNGNIREERFHIWTGVGCHAKDTLIMMADGYLKKVQDVQVGDQLMGDDSKSRNVQELFRGEDDMVEIIPIKGDSFVVNKNHILSLKATNTTSMYFRKDRNTWCVSYKLKDDSLIMVNKSSNFTNKNDALAFKSQLEKNVNVVQQGDVFDVCVNKYIENADRIGRRNLYLYKVPLDFETKKLPVDPYFIGYWLGDGHSNHSSITTMNDEVVSYCKEIFSDMDIHMIGTRGKANTWSICGGLYASMKELNLINNKHIPTIYKLNDVKSRMQLLAGIIDSDGHLQKHTNTYEITLKNEGLMDDTIWLARSLGFACYKHTKMSSTGKYYRIHICGDGIEDIPVKLNYKKADIRNKIKNVLVTGFDVKPLQKDKYYGFELDGNHRYLMDDFTVTHNSNGKSKIIELFEFALGDYCCKFPITLLTQKRAASNAATSELARAKGKRFACLQEPSEDEKLNIGLMKELTGGDKIMARALFKEPIEFKPQFKMILTCNHLPNVPSDDGGTWRRIRVVEFTSKFKENPDPNNPDEFLADTELSTKFMDWKEHFMALLIQYYKKYKAEGITDPEDVMRCTKEYQKNNDCCMDFLEQEVEKDDRGFVSVGDLHVKFGFWIKDSAPHLKPPNRNTFKTAVEKRLGKTVGSGKSSGWKGYRFKQDGLLADDKDALDA